jgi:hypothetical protein
MAVKPMRLEERREEGILTTEKRLLEEERTALESAKALACVCAFLLFARGGGWFACVRGKCESGFAEWRDGAIVEGRETPVEWLLELASLSPLPPPKAPPRATQGH